MASTFFVAGDRCDFVFKTKNGETVIRTGTVSTFTYPHRLFFNGCVEGVTDDGGSFCGDASIFKKHKRCETLTSYATALFAEKIYTSNTFTDDHVEDVALITLQKYQHISPKVSWEITIARYPYLEKAKKEVEQQVDRIGYLLRFWQLFDGIVAAIEGDPDYWREIIVKHDIEFPKNT
jgi:hypothetical protein